MTAAHLGIAMQKIATALLKAKRAFNPVLKDKANPAFKGSKYADLSACLDSVDQPCLDSGIVLYQETSEDSTGVTVETVFLHESGESLRCGKLHVPASKQDPQGYGSALSYARRYSLLAACGIAAEDDDGNAAVRRAESLPPQTISPKQAADIEALISEVGADKVAFLAWVAQRSEGHVAKVSDIPVKAMPDVTKALEAKRNAKKEPA